ncbi:MAG: HNH endonuclease signature motif containing protein, partial [Acidimicrobiales bacterium]
KATSALRAVVSCLGGDGPSAQRVPGDEAARLAAGFSEVAKLATAGAGLCARRVAETRYFERTGHRDAATWLAEVRGEACGAARSLLTATGRLEGLPALQEAFVAGELSAPQAIEAARAGAAAPGLDKELVKLSRSGSLSELRAAADRAEAAARSREEDEARHARIRRGRHLRTWLDADGSFKGRFALTPEDGAVFLSGVEHEANHLFDLARRAGLREPREAYLADALVAVVSGQAGRGGGLGRSGAAGGAGSLEAPHLVAGSPGSLPAGRRAGGAGDAGVSPGANGEPCLPVRHVDSARSSPGPKRRRSPDATILFHVDIEALRRGTLAPGEECVVEGGGHVPLSVIESYLDTARIHLVVKRACDVVSVVSCTRTIPAVLRTALKARDRACVVPGCTSTFHLEIDHIVEFAKGGKTMLSNLCLLCRRHHAMKSKDGYRIEGGPGDWRWVPPPARATQSAPARSGGQGAGRRPLVRSG